MLAVAVMAGGAMQALWRLRLVMPSAGEPDEARGLLLTPTQAPRLWRHVADLAARGHGGA